MDEVMLSVLSKIYTAAKNTSDGYVMCTSIDIRSDMRRKICEWLENQGYIKKVELIGQDKIRCQITEKTKCYFANFL